LFHVGIALILLGLAGWMRPLLDGRPAGIYLPVTTPQVAQSERPAAERAAGVAADRPAESPLQSLFGERPPAPIPAVVKARKLTVSVERGPARGKKVTLRRGDKVTIVKREDRRVLVKDRRGNQVYLSSDQVFVKKSKKSAHAKRRG
jgi:hypothetical protein